MERLLEPQVTVSERAKVRESENMSGKEGDISELLRRAVIKVLDKAKMRRKGSGGKLGGRERERESWRKMSLGH